MVFFIGLSFFIWKEYGKEGNFRGFFGEDRGRIGESYREKKETA